MGVAPDAGVQTLTRGDGREHRLVAHLRPGSHAESTNIPVEYSFPSAVTLAVKLRSSKSPCASITIKLEDPRHVDYPERSPFTYTGNEIVRTVPSVHCQRIRPTRPHETAPGACPLT